MRRILDLILVVVLGATIVASGMLIQKVYFSQDAQDDKIREIYRGLISVSGQSQDALPLFISEELVDNAYNDGNQVVIYRGLINHTKSWDEVALVLSHEIAHGMLGHLSMTIPRNSIDGTGANDFISVLEANADKLGAVYMMKAGWDVCKGRALFLYWKSQYGNSIGMSHPDYDYRYNELNIQCE